MSEDKNKLTISEDERGASFFSFGEAVRMSKLGYRVARKGWNGSGMFLYIVPERMLVSAEVSQHIDNEQLLACDDGAIIQRAHWQLFTAQKDLAMWSPSGSDSLADDWMLVK